MPFLHAASPRPDYATARGGSDSEDSDNGGPTLLADEREYDVASSTNPPAAYTAASQLGDPYSLATSGVHGGPALALQEPSPYTLASATGVAGGPPGTGPGQAPSPYVLASATSGPAHGGASPYTLAAATGSPPADQDAGTPTPASHGSAPFQPAKLEESGARLQELSFEFQFVPGTTTGVDATPPTQAAEVAGAVAQPWQPAQPVQPAALTAAAPARDEFDLLSSAMATGPSQQANRDSARDAGARPVGKIDPSLPGKFTLHRHQKEQDALNKSKLRMSVKQANPGEFELTKPLRTRDQSLKVKAKPKRKSIMRFFRGSSKGGPAEPQAKKLTKKQRKERKVGPALPPCRLLCA